MISIGIIDCDKICLINNINYLSRFNNLKLAFYYTSMYDYNQDVRAVKGEPDVLLIDHKTVNIEEVEWFKKVYTKCKIVLLSDELVQSEIISAIKIGVSGCMIKTNNIHELYEAITVVHTGGCFLGPHVAKIVMDLIKNENIVDGIYVSTSAINFHTLRERGWNVSRGWEVNKIWIFLFIITMVTAFKLISIHHALIFNAWFIALNCLMLLSVVLFMIRQPRLLYGYALVAVEWEMNRTDPKEDAAQLTAIPSPKSNLLSDQMLSAYVKSMKGFMESEKPFLRSDFQIAHLAQKLNIPAHHCSYVINHVIGKNFRDWINAYRIHHFINAYPLLADKMTIEAVALQSGFKSVATFYNAFKKETGLMPTAYFSKNMKH